MRFKPNNTYDGMPCSYVGTGCAYEDIYNKPFLEPLPPNLKEDGWSTLENTNKYIRNIFSGSTKAKIRKKVYYKRSERITLREFLEANTEKCLVCVYGHFIYVNGKDYWSFFDNEDDKVVCVWYIEIRK